MKISLSYRVNGGFVAHIESYEGECAIIETRGGSPAAACRKAATRLRAAASRFDDLSIEAKPYHGVTHRRINRSSLIRVD